MITASVKVAVVDLVMIALFSRILTPFLRWTGERLTMMKTMMMMSRMNSRETMWMNRRVNCHFPEGDNTCVHCVWLSLLLNKLVFGAGHQGHRFRNGQ